MKIRRLNTVLADINLLPSSVHTRQIMGEDELSIAWEMSQLVDFKIGDYTEYNGVKYTLNQLPTVKKKSTTDFEYNAVFQSPAADLAKANYLLFDNTATPPQGQFSLTGKPLVFLQLLVANLNRVAGSEVWFVGDYNDVDAITLDFTDEDCSSVLARLASEFDTEYFVSGNTIHLTEKKTDSNLSLEYGSTLYDLTRQTTDNSNIITRLYAYGSERNIASGYRRGSSKLLMPDPHLCLEKNVDKYGVIEAVKTFDSIYPRLRASETAPGKVTALGASIYEFTDDKMDFDINAQLIAGTTPKIHFNSGYLAGYDFEISGYNASTKTYTIVKNTDEKAYELPNATLGIAIGNEYVILDINMPQSYIDSAESELQTKAQEYLDKNCDPLVTYQCTLSDIFVKINNVILQGGEDVTVKDTQFGVDKKIRNIKITKNLYNGSLKIDLSDTVSPGTWTRTTTAVENNTRDIVSANRDIKTSYFNSYKNVKELHEKVFDTDGYFDPDNIKPLSIETQMLSVGSKSQQFQTDVTLYPNYLGDHTKFAWSGGSLAHFTIDDTQVKTWNVSAGTADVLDFPAYIYARCSKTTNAGEIVLSPIAHKFDWETDYYWFLLGLLHTPIDNVCGISLTYGQTIINGQFIKTGVISSLDGENFINLNTGAGQLAAGNMTWDAIGNLSVKGIIKALSGGSIGKFDLIGPKIVGKDEDGKERLVLSADEILSTPVNLMGLYVNGVVDDWSRFEDTNREVFSGNFYRWVEEPQTNESLSFFDSSLEYVFLLPEASNVKFDSGLGAIAFSEPSAVMSYSFSVYADVYLDGNLLKSNLTEMNTFFVPSGGMVKFKLKTYLSAYLKDNSATQFTISANSYGKYLYQASTEKSELGTNGFYSYWSSAQYLFFHKEYGFEVCLGNYRFKITSAGGIQKSTDGGQNWTNI